MVPRIKTLSIVVATLLSGLLYFGTGMLLVGRGYSGESDGSEYQPTATADERARAEGLKRLAEQGNVDAQNDLCILYTNGYIFKANLRTAAKWARASADQGSVKGQVNLGTFYFAGSGVPLDYAQARYWL
jgi:TPR repeat protein